MMRFTWLVLLAFGCCPDPVVIRPVNMVIQTDNTISVGPDTDQRTQQRTIIMRDGRIIHENSSKEGR
jgi:hypothetical protein